MEINVTDSNFEEEVLQAELPVLVDFWAEWCAPCRMIGPLVEEIARDFEGKLKVCKLNVDQGGATATRYGIAAVPTLMIFKAGQPVDQVVGMAGKEALEEKIKSHL